jgi:hypothetical protein
MRPDGVRQIPTWGWTCPPHGTKRPGRSWCKRRLSGGRQHHGCAAESTSSQQASIDGDVGIYGALVEPAEHGTGKSFSGDLFDTGGFLKNDNGPGVIAAVPGRSANANGEALCLPYFIDRDGNRLEGACCYRLRFAPAQLLPANACWSLSIYELPTNRLYALPPNRTAINSAMLGLRYDGDGGLTFDIQHRSPGKNEPNWLPSPAGLFWIMLSLCWSGPLDGRWEHPFPQRMQ